jgi:uncharacterized repeat protein (TIGR03803 family)
MKSFLTSFFCLFVCLIASQAQPNLFGLMFGGGSSNYGTILNYNGTTGTITASKNFSIPSGGVNPSAGLIKGSNNLLYGMVIGGGNYGFGVIFSYNPTTTAYTVLVNFNGPNGSYPLGSLVQASNGNLYGMTEEGGTNNVGVIFSYNPSTTAYSVLENFNVSNGSYPLGSLVQASNGNLYGMTEEGGTNGLGVIFSYNPSTTTYSVLENFGGTNGSFPAGSLVQASNGNLYGMTEEGGIYGLGVIFSYNPSTTVYSVLENFSTPNGSVPYGSLVQASNGNLYGMTEAGGTNNGGVIFSYNPFTTAYTVLENFNGTNGSNPLGNLMQASDGNLYGMTYEGGANNVGVIFSYNPSIALYTKLADLSSVTGDNPYFGSAFVEVLIALNVQLTSSDQTICLNSTANSLSVTVTGNNGSPLTYQWYSNTVSSNIGGTLIPGANSSSFAPPTSIVGSLYYYCLVNSSGGATGTSNISGQITVTAGAIAGNISGAISVCTGNNSTVLTLSGSTGKIQWQSSTDNITFSDIPEAISANYTALNLINTTYYKAIVTNGTCTATTPTVIMTVNPLPVVSAITGNTSVCAGQMTTLTDATAGGVWSSDNTSVASIDASGIVTGVASGTATISYLVTSGSGCATTVSTIVTVNPLPVVSAITGNTSVCAGQMTTLTDATAGGVWSSANNSVASVSSSGVVTILNSGTAKINYTVTNSSGCRAVASIIFVINPPITVAPITGNTKVCAGSSSSLSDATNGGSWISSNAAIATVNQAGVVTGIAPGTTTITYSVTSNSCMSSVSTSVTVNAAPVVAAISGPNFVITGSSITLSDPTPSGFWSSSSTSIATITQGGVVKGLSAGQCTVTYKISSASGCATIATKIISVYNPLSVSLTAGKISCNNGTTILKVNVTGGSGSYQYSLNGGKLQTENSFNLSEGLYLVIVKDNVTSQLGVNGIYISQPSPLLLSLVTKRNASNGSSNGSFTVIGTGGVSPYKYSINGTNFQNSGVFNNLKAGTYNVSIRDANNCSSTKMLTVIISNQISKNDIGTVTPVSSIVEINKGSTNVELFEAKIFPNPSATEFNLQIVSGINQTVDVLVFDMYDHLVYRTKGETTNTFRFGQDLPGGSYIVQVIYKNGMKVLKVIKQ